MALQTPIIDVLKHNNIPFSSFTDDHYNNQC
jgi:hypothetical protein